MTRALERLRSFGASWNEVLPAEAVRVTAQRLLRTHSLRAADSLQLAAAIVASEHDPASLGIVFLEPRGKSLDKVDATTITRGCRGSTSPGLR